MKTYFAKYLPVEGEIKEGDLYISHFHKQPAVMDKINIWSFPLQKVKLFLCSRDIQVGDKVITPYPTNSENIINENNLQYFKELTIIPLNKVSNEGVWLGAYKVVGEISPETLSYVKEGQEFDEDDFYVTEECPHYNGKHMWKDCSCKIGFVNGVYIKTPKK